MRSEAGSGASAPTTAPPEPGAGGPSTTASARINSLWPFPVQRPLVFVSGGGFSRFRAAQLSGGFVQPSHGGAPVEDLKQK